MTFEYPSTYGQPQNLGGSYGFLPNNQRVNNGIPFSNGIDHNNQSPWASATSDCNADTNQPIGNYTFSDGFCPSFEAPSNSDCAQQPAIPNWNSSCTGFSGNNPLNLDLDLGLPQGCTPNSPSCGGGTDQNSMMMILLVLLLSGNSNGNSASNSCNGNGSSNSCSSGNSTTSSTGTSIPTNSTGNTPEQVTSDPHFFAADGTQANWEPAVGTNVSLLTNNASGGRIVAQTGAVSGQPSLTIFNKVFYDLGNGTKVLYSANGSASLVNDSGTVLSKLTKGQTVTGANGNQITYNGDSLSYTLADGQDSVSGTTVCHSFDGTSQNCMDTKITSSQGNTYSGALANLLPSFKGVKVNSSTGAGMFVNGQDGADFTLANNIFTY